MMSIFRLLSNFIFLQLCWLLIYTVHMMILLIVASDVQLCNLKRDLPLGTMIFL